MQRHTLSSITIGISLIANAQLSPQQEAPLITHMMEVNKEWRTMDPSLNGGDRMVHFSNEAERIAMHLHLVRDFLAAHGPEDLSAKITRRRDDLLAQLDAYADREVFPQNRVLPFRNPVFIDPHGTACAVGQLMIESGHGDLAQRIHDEMNLAYVHDMKRADVLAWAGDHGFTEDELAWIQPGYPPNTIWSPVGGGTDGPVTEMLRLANNDLLVAGQFAHAGGVAAMNAARWDGNVYHPYGAGVNGDVDAATEFNGSIYLGGSFNGGFYDLAKWNGSSWEYSTVFSGKSSHISDLCVHNGSLHASGEAAGFVGNSCSVAKLNSGTWVPVGLQLNGVIRKLISFNGQLMCGGDFTGHGQQFLSTDSTVQHVASFGGTDWQQLGDGLNGNVNDLFEMSAHLYAGGSMINNIIPRFGLARIATGGSTWEELLPNLTTYISGWLGSSASISSLQDVDGELYFGGSFSTTGFGTNGSQLARYTGVPDGVEAIAAFDAPVNDLEALDGPKLICGGSFTNNAGNETPYIASTDITTRIPSNASGSLQLIVWPNPASDLLRIDLGERAGTNAIIEVIDASGRTVITSSERSAIANIDVGALRAGTYIVRMKDDRRERTVTFVKR